MEYWNAVYRRKWQVLTIISVGLVITVALVTSWPTFYRSVAQISVEDHVRADEFRSVGIADYADKYLRRISGEVDNRKALLGVISGGGSDRKERQEHNDADLVDLMRRRLSIEMESSELNQSNVPGENRLTMTYQVSFRDPDPVVAKQVVEQLAGQHLAANNEYLAGKAAKQLALHREESSKLNSQMQSLIKKQTQLNKDIAAIEAEYPDGIAKIISVDQQKHDSAEADLKATHQAIDELESQRSGLQAQLAAMKPTIVITTEVNKPIDMEARQTALENRLKDISAKLGEDHPQVKQVRNELKAVNEQIQKKKAAERKARELEQLRQVLAKMHRTRPADDPDLVMMTELKNRFERELESPPAGLVETRQVESTRPNPEYQSLQSAIESVSERYKAAVSNSNMLKKTIDALESELSRTQEVNTRHDTLIQDRDRLDDELNAVKASLNGVKPVAVTEGDRAHAAIIKPAQLPAYSEKSQSYLVLIIGLVISVIAAFIYLVVAEHADNSIRGAAALAALGASAQPICVIPYIYTQAEQSRNRIHKVMLSISLVVGLLLLIAGTKYLQPALNKVLLTMF